VHQCILATNREPHRKTPMTARQAPPYLGLDRVVDALRKASKDRLLLVSLDTDDEREPELLLCVRDRDCVRTRAASRGPRRCSTCLVEGVVSLDELQLIFVESQQRLLLSTVGRESSSSSCLSCKIWMVAEQLELLVVGRMVDHLIEANVSRASL